MHTGNIRKRVHPIYISIGTKKTPTPNFSLERSFHFHWTNTYPTTYNKTLYFDRSMHIYVYSSNSTGIVSPKHAAPTNFRLTLTLIYLP